MQIAAVSSWFQRFTDSRARILEGTATDKIRLTEQFDT
jgi:hypothetical protein